MIDRKEILTGVTFSLESGCGKLYITVNKDETGKIVEVFCNSGKSGSCENAITSAMTKTIAISLQAGVDVKLIIDDLKNIKCPKANGFGSCPHVIALALEMARTTNSLHENKMQKFVDEYSEMFYMTNQFDPENDIIHEVYDEEEKMEFCGSCGSQSVYMSEGCMTCLSCGWSACSV